MNIEDVEVPFIEARTCGGENKRGVAYKFMDAFHSLCLDKKDILLAEIEAQAEAAGLKPVIIDESSRPTWRGETGDPSVIPAPMVRKLQAGE